MQDFRDVQSPLLVLAFSAALIALMVSYTVDAEPLGAQISRTQTKTPFAPNAPFTRCNDYDSRHSRFLVTLFDTVYSELFVVQPDVYRLLDQACRQCIAQLECARDGEQLGL